MVEKNKLRYLGDWVNIYISFLIEVTAFEISKGALVIFFLKFRKLLLQIVMIVIDIRKPIIIAVHDLSPSYHYPYYDYLENKLI